MNPNKLLKDQTAIVTGAGAGNGAAAAKAMAEAGARVSDYITGTTLFADGGMLYSPPGPARPSSIMRR